LLLAFTRTHTPTSRRIHAGLVTTLHTSLVYFVASSWVLRLFHVTTPYIAGGLLAEIAIADGVTAFHLAFTTPIRSGLFSLMLD